MQWNSYTQDYFKIIWTSQPADCQEFPHTGAFSPHFKWQVNLGIASPQGGTVPGLKPCRSCGAQQDISPGCKASLIASEFPHCAFQWTLKQSLFTIPDYQNESPGDTLFMSPLPLGTCKTTSSYYLGKCRRTLPTTKDFSEAAKNTPPLPLPHHQNK